VDTDELARLVDHTLLRPEATALEIQQVCEEALSWGCAAVCVNSSRLAEVAQRLRGSMVAACAVVGFPLGAADTATKVAETEYCVAHGASEVDTVLNLGWLRDRALVRVVEDVAAVRRAAGPGVLLKVIVESALLSPDEIREASLLAVQGGADFVKTSTGLHAAGGASVEAVRTIRASVPPQVGVKASGGIRSLAGARAMLDAGASRLGLSATVQVLEQLRAEQSTRDSAP